MTEQQNPDEQDQEQQLPTPAPATEPSDPAVQAKPEPTGSGRFAVYDLTLTQYVGPVVDRKPTKADARKLVREGHDFEVREV